jgi:hypothetical protein
MSPLEERKEREDREREESLFIDDSLHFISLSLSLFSLFLFETQRRFLNEKGDF